MNSSILIYDKSEILIELTKYYCGNKIDVTFCNCGNDLSKLKLDVFNTAYLRINENFDLLEVLKIYSSIDNLYVSASSEEIKLSLKLFEKIIFFDIERDKFKIMDQIFNKIIDFG